MYPRCFPKFNATLLAHTLSIGGDSSVDFSSKVSSLKDNFGGSGERLQRYVGDISKGWLIIVVSGLIVGILLSMVRQTILAANRRVEEQLAAILLFDFYLFMGKY